jgi:hypothetical protein
MARDHPRNRSPADNRDRAVGGTVKRRDGGDDDKGAYANPITAIRKTVTIADPSFRTGASDENARTMTRPAT